MEPLSLEDPELGWAPDVPWIAIDQFGLIQAVTPGFTEAFGWRAAELVGRPLQVIIPKFMRDAHNISLSRFVEAGRGSTIGQPRRLPLLTASGGLETTETCLYAANLGGDWYFGAQIVPLGTWNEQGMGR